MESYEAASYLFRVGFCPELNLAKKKKNVKENSKYCGGGECEDR